MLFGGPANARACVIIRRTISGFGSLRIPGGKVRAAQCLANHLGVCHLADNFETEHGQTDRRSGGDGSVWGGV